MRKLLLSAATLALLATPALAQGGKAEFGRQAQAQQMDQAQREQAAREIMTDAIRRQNQGQPPPAQNQRPDQRPGRDGASNQNNQGRPDSRNDNRRDDRRDWDRRDNDRRNWDRGNNWDRRGNWDNNRGPRRDYNSFRDYHRAYNAPRRYRVAPYRRPSGFYERRWTFGEFLPAAFWAASYWLNDFNRYDLPPPPYGTVWVRYGSDALLVDRDTGEVISVRYGMFY